MWKICLRYVIPLLIHDEKFDVFLFIKKLGLFQIGVCLVGEKVVLVVW